MTNLYSFAGLLSRLLVCAGAVSYTHLRKNVDAKLKEEQTTRGTLFCAGMIAGEGLSLIHIYITVLYLCGERILEFASNFSSYFLLKLFSWRGMQHKKSKPLR